MHQSTNGQLSSEVTNQCMVVRVDVIIEEKGGRSPVPPEVWNDLFIARRVSGSACRSRSIGCVVLYVDQEG